ncbi:MAG: hypothetical protein RQ824_09875 [bacterium]|nr:hypothetical protein [bacterium]
MFMKKRFKSIAGIAFLLSFFGCSVKGTVRGDYVDLKVGEKVTAHKGEIFFAQRDDPATPVQEASFNLSVFRLSDREIILKLVEFGRVDNNGGEIEKKESLKPLPSVKTFTYPLSEKVIRFQGFTFRVLRVADDAIIYQRLR